MTAKPGKSETPAIARCEGEKICGQQSSTNSERFPMLGTFMIMTLNLLTDGGCCLFSQIYCCPPLRCKCTAVTRYSSTCWFTKYNSDRWTVTERWRVMPLQQSETKIVSITILVVLAINVFTAFMATCVCRFISAKMVTMGDGLYCCESGSHDHTQHSGPLAQIFQ